jgi:hypothetical protein
VLMLVAIVAAVGYATVSLLPSGSANGGAAANGPSVAVDRVAVEAAALPGPLLLRAVDPRAPRADGQLLELFPGGDLRPIRGLACKRVHAVAHGPGLCLRVSDRGDSYEGVVFDSAYEEVARFRAAGVPDRVRVSSDGRFGAYTSFDARQSPMYFETVGDFSTYTRIVDMRTGDELLRLEDLRFVRAGRPFAIGEAELWGVTFADDRSFYATLATRGEHYLIQGRIGSRRARVVAERVECPALSPDGTRIAYKRRIGDTNRWRFGVMDLASGRSVALSEPRSTDDQPEWLDEERIVYSDDRDVFVVPSDGTGNPTRLARGATSPVSLAGP